MAGIAVVIVGCALILYGGLISAFVSADGNTPGDIPGTVLVLLGLLVGCAGVKLAGGHLDP